MDLARRNLHAGGNPGAGLQRDTVIETGPGTDTGTEAQRGIGADHRGVADARAPAQLGLRMNQGFATDVGSLREGDPRTEMSAPPDAAAGLEVAAAADGRALPDRHALSDPGTVANGNGGNTDRPCR